MFFLFLLRAPRETIKQPPSELGRMERAPTELAPEHLITELDDEVEETRPKRKITPEIPPSEKIPADIHGPFLDVYSAYKEWAKYMGAENLADPQLQGPIPFLYDKARSLAYALADKNEKRALEILNGLGDQLLVIKSDFVTLNEELKDREQRAPLGAEDQKTVATLASSRAISKEQIQRVERLLAQDRVLTAQGARGMLESQIRLTADVIKYTEKLLRATETHLKPYLEQLGVPERTKPEQTKMAA